MPGTPAPRAASARELAERFDIPVELLAKVLQKLARANLLAMEAGCADEAFNIGFGKGTTINELVRELLDLTESSLEPEYRAEERSFVTERIGSIDKAERLLGFRAATPLREGLQNLIAWRAR